MTDDGTRTVGDDEATQLEPVSVPPGVHDLLQQVHSLLRHASRALPGDENREVRLRFGPVEIDLERRVVLRHGVPVNITPREYALLLALAERRGGAVKRDELLKIVWDADHTPTAAKRRTVDQHVCRLRRKLEPAPSIPRYILTVPGWGYRLAGLESPPISAVDP